MSGHTAGALNLKGKAFIEPQRSLIERLNIATDAIRVGAFQDRFNQRCGSDIKRRRADAERQKMPVWVSR
jgi:hypothetical protein